MSFLRGSENYVWCTTSVLGKGATGAVFQGVNKNNGEPVAVKTFNQLSHMRPHDVQMREFEVLKKVKHKNIVKLLAIEEEQEGRGKVIVMELCTGGSLFNILDDPENTYGLQEQEFLLVLEHLTAGMKHLRDNNLVHRDLKPGNIMKYINEDGTTTYKLTDFGAARELQEEEQFVSLYGTEEYLHPDMYERAVLRKPVGKSFGATVDLWSIGVTLYHVATGQLPFRPYGGRRNKETMFYITTKKASGVISGTQTTENGPIEWSRELPAHCQLSVGLRKLVTPLLAGLLEVDPHRIWSFERFFSEVQIATSTIPVHIFHVNKASSLKVFLKPDEKFEHLQTYILEQTSVVAESQIILYKDRLLLTEIEENTLGKNFPETTEERPLMLFNKNNHNVSLPPEPDPPKFPVFPNIVSVENDATQAKTACSVGHAVCRRVEALCAASVLCALCVRWWGGLVGARLQAAAARAHHCAAHADRLHSAARALQLAARRHPRPHPPVATTAAPATTAARAREVRAVVGRAGRGAAAGGGGARAPLRRARRPPALGRARAAAGRAPAPAPAPACGHYCRACHYCRASQRGACGGGAGWSGRARRRRRRARTTAPRTQTACTRPRARCSWPRAGTRARTRLWPLLPRLPLLPREPERCVRWWGGLVGARTQAAAARAHHCAAHADRLHSAARALQLAARRHPRPHPPVATTAAPATTAARAREVRAVVGRAGRGAHAGGGGARAPLRRARRPPALGRARAAAGRAPAPAPAPACGHYCRACHYCRASQRGACGGGAGWSGRARRRRRRARTTAPRTQTACTRPRARCSWPRAGTRARTRLWPLLPRLPLLPREPERCVRWWGGLVAARTQAAAARAHHC
ncbi:unnamed protein product [Chilo suppressalis]|uniref:Protein kinase domain-containing protein n=1 Tax=Chilo suppressalis TaxID=168631 RepID=A0ABN8B6J9_CHISP|nr:unnamed protein product [Chilo suppressalis]